MNGHSETIHAPDRQTAGADRAIGKAAITSSGVADRLRADVPERPNSCDRLFKDPHPDVGCKDFIEALNPDSLKVVTAYVKPSLAAAKPDDKFQFERFGYFVAHRVDHGVDGKAVFNRVTGLKDSWGNKWR